MGVYDKDDPAGIVTIGQEAATTQSDIYDLQGRKVTVLVRALRGYDGYGVLVYGVFVV